MPRCKRYLVPFVPDMVFDMVASSNGFEQFFESRGFPGLKSFEGEWEIVIRGKMGNSSTDFELLGDAAMLTIISTYESPTVGKISILGNRIHRYTFNPFHPNADFDLSIHRMSGKKAGLIQVTVRSNSRIASYYVETKTMVTDSIRLNIKPEDSREMLVYQAVLNT